MLGFVHLDPLSTEPTEPPAGQLAREKLRADLAMASADLARARATRPGRPGANWDADVWEGGQLVTGRGRRGRVARPGEKVGRISSAVEKPSRGDHWRGHRGRRVERKPS